MCESVGQNPFSKANSCAVSQEYLRVSCSRKIHYCVHKNQETATGQSADTKTRVNIPQLHLFNININIT